MLSKMGRPKSDNPVDKRFTVCLDSEMNNRLEKYCDENSVTKSVAIREALRLLFAKNK